MADAVEEAADLELAAGVARSDAASYSSVAAALDAVAADVLVDYTHASVVKGNVHAAVERGVNVVVGSSGLSAADYDEIDAAARDRSVGVVAAGNFSLTAAVMLRAATEAARHLAAWEVVDYASAGKPDAPSGTARELAERLGAVGTPAAAVPVDEVLGPRAARGATIAGTQVHSVRLPSFVVSTESRLRGARRAAVDSPRRGREPRPVRRRNAARDPCGSRPRRPHARARPAPPPVGSRPDGRPQAWDRAAAR